MPNSKLHQLVWTLTIGLAVLHLAASSSVRKFPRFFDRSTMDEGCVDTHPDCSWIPNNVENYINGYCQQHREMMEGWCAKTCQLCGKLPAPPEPETVEPTTVETETVEPETAKPPAPTQQPSGLSGFQENCLEAHNEFRSRHNSPPLKWSADLLRDAQRWANHLANTKTFYHDYDAPGIGQGENLYYFSPPKPLCNGPKNGHCVTCHEIVKEWYDEIKDWDFNRGEGKFPGAVVLHFTQVVWKGTTEMAMAIAVANNRLVAVARYSPRGNMGGTDDFKKNVEFGT